MKKVITLCFVVLACLVLTTACKKTHQCKCTTTDVTDDNRLKILFVDGGINCESITEMGLEEKYTTDDGKHSLRRTEVHTVSCIDYGE